MRHDRHADKDARCTDPHASRFSRVADHSERLASHTERLATRTERLASRTERLVFQTERSVRETEPMTIQTIQTKRVARHAERRARLVSCSRPLFCAKLVTFFTRVDNFRATTEPGHETPLRARGGPGTRPESLPNSVDEGFQGGSGRSGQLVQEPSVDPHLHSRSMPDPFHQVGTEDHQPDHHRPQCAQKHRTCSDVLRLRDHWVELGRRNVA